MHITIMLTTYAHYVDLKGEIKEVLLLGHDK
uniref:Uncharacterized protein n=1 Tax=Vibrio parahaemolyticus TaxID=670 RepID=A0A0C5HCK8_VIBPH|nr:hypothetical protein pVPH1_0014 [Vibrio parahaemolyticus]